MGTTGARLDGDPVPLDHTTPEAPDLQALLARMRDADVALVAMEVSSHALAHHRVDGTHFTVICFTNLSHDHLDFHGDVDSYFEAKARAFSAAFADAVVTNLDDEHGRVLADRARAAGLPVVTYGIDAPDADVRATDVVLEATHTTFVLHDGIDGVPLPVTSPLLGAFNVSNALAAAATARVAGLPADAIVAGLDADLVVPGRLEPVDGGQPFTVLVDYAHTPDALEQALAAARAVADAAGADRRVVVVFGCGGDRDLEKRAPMGRVAASGANVAIITNDNPRSEDPEAIAAEVLGGMHGGRAEVALELDRRAAIGRALDAAGAGDVVLLAGKGHETTQTTHGRSVPFDDRVVVREELGVRTWS